MGMRECQHETINVATENRLDVTLFLTTVTSMDESPVVAQKTNPIHNKHEKGKGGRGRISKHARSFHNHGPITSKRTFTQGGGRLHLDKPRLRPAVTLIPGRTRRRRGASRSKGGCSRLCGSEHSRYDVWTPGR